MEVAHTTRRWLDSVGDRLGVTPYAFVVGVLAIAVAGAAGWWAFSAPDPPAAEEVLPRVEGLAGGPPSAPAAAVAKGPTTTVSAVIVVHVDGAGMVPGVHELSPGSRVFDAIEAAQGLLPDADRSRLNLAAVVGDGQRVWVPRLGEEEPAVIAITGATGGGGAAAGDPIVDLNTADAARLETLPGIGPSIAAAIVSHRQEHGAFRRVDDLLDVPGIGPAKLDRLEALVTV